MNGRTNTSGITVNNGISIPLEAPTNLLLSAGDQTVSMTWTDPIDKYTETFNELVSQWSYDTIVRKEGSVPSSPQDGTVVAKITSKNQHQNTPFTDTGMENDKRWYYSVYSWNQFGTPSEKISGSEIPTARIALEYIQEISPLRTDLPSSDFNRVVLIGSNGSHVFILSSYEHEDDVYLVYDQNLVKSTKPSIAQPADTRTINDRDYAPMQIGSNLVIIRNKNNYDYDGSPYSYYIDANSVEHLIDFYFTGPSHNSGFHIMMAGASIDNSVGYAIKSERNDAEFQSVKIDSNFITTSLGNITDSPANNIGWSTVKPRLSSTSHAFFGNFSNSQVYAYDTNALRSNVSIQNNSCNAFSRCMDYDLVWGAPVSYQGTEWNLFSISSQLVTSLMQTTPYNTNYDIVGISYSTPSNIQAIGCGIVPIFESENVECPIYYGCKIVNKNLVLQDNNDIIPLEIGSRCGYDTKNSTDCPHLGKYIFVPLLFGTKFDTDTSATNGTIAVIKNAYESDLEEV